MIWIILVGLHHYILFLSGNLNSYTTLNLCIFRRWWFNTEVLQLVKQGSVATLVLWEQKQHRLKKKTHRLTPLILKCKTLLVKLMQKWLINMKKKRVFHPCVIYTLEKAVKANDVSQHLAVCLLVFQTYRWSNSSLNSLQRKKQNQSGHIAN